MVKENTLMPIVGTGPLIREKMINGMELWDKINKVDLMHSMIYMLWIY